MPLGDGEPDVLGVALRLPAALGGALGVPDGLRSDAMLRPRYVRLATAASASPASHSSDDSSTPLAMAFEGTSCVTLASRKHGAGVESQRREGSARANE